jgi:hypothetical protein
VTGRSCRREDFRQLQTAARERTPTCMMSQPGTSPAASLKRRRPLAADADDPGVASTACLESRGAARVGKCLKTARKAGGELGNPRKHVKHFKAGGRGVPLNVFENRAARARFLGGAKPGYQRAAGLRGAVTRRCRWCAPVGNVDPHGVEPNSRGSRSAPPDSVAFAMRTPTGFHTIGVVEPGWGSVVLGGQPRLTHGEARHWRSQWHTAVGSRHTFTSATPPCPSRSWGTRGRELLVRRLRGCLHC